MHLPRLCTVILDGQSPIQFFRPYSWISPWGGWMAAESRAFACPTCLRIWGKLHVEGFDQFSIRSHPCEQHPTTFHDVAGSLFPNDYSDGTIRDQGLWLNLPDSLLAREGILHLNHHARYFHEYSHNESFSDSD